jgi:hypothetical protein
MLMLQADKTPESRYEDAPLWVCVRFLATWLLGGTLLGVLFGPWTGIAVGLLIAIGYVKAVHWTVVLAVLAPRSRDRHKRRDSRVLGP